MKYLVLLVLLFPSVIRANEKIEAPTPKPITVEHKFYDRTAKIETATALALNTWDNVQTCRNLGNTTRPIIAVVTAVNGKPVHEVVYGPATPGREDYLPVQSCGAVTALLAGQLVGQEFVAYLLHRTHHHKVERIARFFTIEGNLQGIIYSAKHTRKSGAR